MKLIAKKPCSFGGERFYIGDEIPVESVLDPVMQEKRGVLAIVNEDAAAPEGPAADSVVVETMAVVIHAEEGDLPLDLNQEGLQTVLDVLPSNAKDAEKIVSQMTDGDALIFLDIADSRNTVKKAVKARAQALNTEPETPEESAGDQ